MSIDISSSEKNSLNFVAPPPDTLGFGGFDQVFTHIGMSDVYQGFCPLPRGQAGQVGYAVFRDHVWRLGPRRRDDIAGSELGEDVGMADSLLIDPARRHGQEGFAVVGGIGNGYEVQLAASPADVPRTGRFGADLAV